MSDLTYSGGGDDDLVSLLVPRRLYGIMVQRLAEEMSANGAAPAPISPADAPASAKTFSHREWTRDDVRRLKETVQNPSVRTILDLATERNGEWISIREVEQRTGRKFGQVRADLAGLSQTVKRRFGRSNWPFMAEWAVDGKPQVSYRVPPHVARWWKEA